MRVVILAGGRGTRLAEETSLRPKPMIEIGGRLILCGEGWINGGFFVFEPRLFDYIDGDRSALERQPLERLAADGELMAYRHDGFWQPMDTLRERELLESLWSAGSAPWKIWHD